MFNWSDIFTPDAQTTSEAEANYARQKAILLDQSIYRQATDPYYDPTSDNAALSGHLEDKNSAAAKGFIEGLGDGLKNIKHAVTGFGPFQFIPAWLWIVGAVALFVWIGGAAWSKGRLNK